MVQDGGVTISEALARWTPMSLWRRYQEIAGYDVPLLSLSGMDPLQNEARRLRSEIGQVLIERLARGELIASGIAVPLTGRSRRRDIPPELWARLGFGHGFGAVVGDAVRYEEVLVREDPGPTSSMTGQEQLVPVPQARPDRPGRSRPGRPSMMPRIEAEMRRRAEAGQLASSMRRQAKDLVAWAERQVHDGKVPKAESIERVLAPTYRELQPKNRTEKYPINY